MQDYANLSHGRAGIRTVIVGLVFAAGAFLAAGAWIGSKLMPAVRVVDASGNVLRSIATATERPNPTVRDYLERQAATNAREAQLQEDLREKERQILDLQARLDEIRVEEAEVRHEVEEADVESAEADREVAALPPEVKEACEVPIAALDAKTKLVASLREHVDVVTKRARTVERMYWSANSAMTWWQQAHNEQKALADEGALLVKKLNKRKFRLRPALFAGIAYSPGRSEMDGGPWSPVVGVGLALTWGK